RPASLGVIVLRMLSNLKAVYLNQGDFVRAVRVLRRLCQLCPDDPVQRRDLGVASFHAGQPGQAIDHLAAYVEALPGADDVLTVQQFLTRARGQVARWN